MLSKWWLIGAAILGLMVLSVVGPELGLSRVEIKIAAAGIGVVFSVVFIAVGATRLYRDRHR